LYGGNKLSGVVFRINPSGTPTAFYKFNHDASGGSSGLTLGQDGNFYGATWNVYTYDGTIFRITPGGSLTVLYSFTGGTDGSSPLAPPIQGTDGSLYGTTSCHSDSCQANAYRISTSGSFTLLAALPGSSAAPLIQATDGNFYGTSTSDDGTYRYGTVFKLTPQGVLTVVYKFDGAPVSGPVIQGRDGNFYGTTQGVVFKLTPRGSMTVLHTFGDPNYPNDGRNPFGGLVEATDGNFYGVTTYGGTNFEQGVIYRINSAGVYSVLYNFVEALGRQASSTPIQHTNGNIYGAAGMGGTNMDGVLYSLDLGLAPFVRLVSTSGKVGTPITILGQGFTGASSVSFNGTQATFKVWSDTYLKATVPSGATTGSVTVTTASGMLTSNQPFRVRPVILSVTPATGAAGTPVIITGTSLTQTTKVTFGGDKAAATFTVDSDTQVTATVPAGAPAGYIVLTTTGGRSRSPEAFTVTP
jgi:uncharacterized repeat protein (TIGR03803 family)